MSTMKSKLVAKGISVDMFVGICDFEYNNAQRVVVNVEASGIVPVRVKNINDCLDYSKICEYVASWKDRKHVELVETLALDVFDFMFKDPRIEEVNVEILKPHVIKHTEYVGVSQRMTRKEYQDFRLSEEDIDGGW